MTWEPPLLAVLVALLLALPNAAVTATAHEQVTARVAAAPAMTRSAPARAGRSYFRIRTMGALPVAPARTVTHPAKPKNPPRTLAVKPAQPRAEVTYTVPAGAKGSVAVLLAFLRAQLGDPYRFGASGPNAWDCSGLVDGAYRTVGIVLPHKAAAFYGVGRAVPRSQLQPGDIIIMGGGSHAGIYVGNGLMIHAPHTGDHVRIAPISNFSAARRLL